MTAPCVRAGGWFAFGVNIILAAAFALAFKVL